MKTPKLYIFLGLALGCITASGANAVAVDFVDAEKFTDFKATAAGRTSQSFYIKELSKFVSSKIEKRLPPGYKAEVVITDVDMAGEFEPWRAGSFGDVRIVKDLYPPRINLSFRVLNEAGEVTAIGDRKLRDLKFMYSTRPLNEDPLKHEKELLADWISREFRKSDLT